MALLRCIGGGSSLQQQRERFECIKSLYEFSVTGGRGFVAPSVFSEYCKHEWIVLDAGYACCQICGQGHVCSSMGTCLEAKCQDSSVVCTITGVVIIGSEFREERNVDERISYMNASSHHHHHGNGVLFDDMDVEEEPMNRRKRKKKNVDEDKLKNNEKKYSVRLKKKNRKLHDDIGGDVTSISIERRFLVVSAFDNDIGKFCEVVEANVTDILASDKTRLCFEQEIKRNECKLTSLLSRLLRECTHNKECIRPNILSVFAQLYFYANKCRLSYNNNRCIHSNDNTPIMEEEGEWNSSVDTIRQTIHFWGVRDADNHCDSTLSSPASSSDKNILVQLIKVCSQSISNLLLLHGGPRVLRHLQSGIRCREFICSMLYLMRMGITYENRQLLPKIDILHQYLPMQVLLPVVFKIRAKSITEGENIIKLDIRKMPLI